MLEDVAWRDHSHADIADLTSARARQEVERVWEHVHPNSCYGIDQLHEEPAIPSVREVIVRDEELTSHDGWHGVRRFSNQIEIGPRLAWSARATVGEPEL